MSHSIRPCQNFCSEYVIDSGANEITKAITPNLTIEQFEEIKSRYPEYNLKMANSSGLHAFSIAVLKGNFKLINHMAEMDKDLINFGDTRGITPLLFAIAYDKNLDLIKTLLNLGADPNIYNFNSFGIVFHMIQANVTPLYMAVKKSYITYIELLLKNGASEHIGPENRLNESDIILIDQAKEKIENEKADEAIQLLLNKPEFPT